MLDINIKQPVNGAKLCRIDLPPKEQELTGEENPHRKVHHLMSYEKILLR